MAHDRNEEERSWRDEYGEYRDEPPRSRMRHGGRRPFGGATYGYYLAPYPFPYWPPDIYDEPYRYRRGPHPADSDRDFWDRAGDEVSSWFGDEEAERRRRRDRHRGKGPKGYVRSDARIHEEVSDRIMEDGAVDGTEIVVSVKDGEVTLSGTVSSRFEKRRAEDCADSVCGVKHTQNNLRVNAEDLTRGAGI